MFVIGREGPFGYQHYLMNYRRVNDGATPSLASAHKYKTDNGANKGADRANDRVNGVNNWHAVEIVKVGDNYRIK